MRLKITARGKTLVAGIDGAGSINAIISWARRTHSAKTANTTHEELSLNVGGMEGEDFLDWMRDLKLDEGDVVQIEVLSAGPADKPSRRKGF